MRIGVLTGSISRSAGGFFHSVRRLALSLQELPETEVRVFSFRDQHSEADLSAWQPLQPELHPFRGPAGFRYSPALARAVSQAKCDVIHTHGIWLHLSAVALREHRCHGIPHIISPRGMLDPWAVRQSRWKKLLAGWWFERAHLCEARCLHALAQSELAAIRGFGLANPVAIIPNGIDLPEPVAATAPWQGLFGTNERVLLFLARLHPKKGIAELIRAWAAVRRRSPELASSWRLVVAGWDDGGHEAGLKRLSAELGLNGKVAFLGSLFNEQKAAALAHCAGFILPSFSEGLPMGVLEAWAYGKPVLMTAQCNLPEGFAAGAALEMAPSVESIATALRTLFSMSRTVLGDMGEKGGRLVAERFTWLKIACDMRSVYDWVLGSGTRPDCVVLPQDGASRLPRNAGAVKALPFGSNRIRISP
ncbi:MAG: glycosyltransferase [Verrucomicrobiae bacterium]|nr:glycosyltransferase [Verrucomicrobiae bacterium]